MIADEDLLKKLEEKYSQLFYADAALHGYMGAISTSLIIGFILTVYLLSIIVTNTIELLPIIILWPLMLFKIFRGVKYLPVKNSLIKEVQNIQENLYTTLGLNYCGCDTGGHYINKKTEQLWNIKSKILFDSHSFKKYNEWNSQWKYDSKWLVKYYCIAAGTLVAVNLCLTTYIFIL